jgi:hypothetical protein
MQPKPRSRKRTFPLFPDPTPEQRQALASEDHAEIVRSGFPELSRCDHCGVLDENTQRLEVGPEDAKQKRWLHPACAAGFVLLPDLPMPQPSLAHTVPPRPPLGPITLAAIRGKR